MDRQNSVHLDAFVGVIPGFAESLRNETDVVYNYCDLVDCAAPVIKVFELINRYLVEGGWIPRDDTAARHTVDPARLSDTSVLEDFAFSFSTDANSKAASLPAVETGASPGYGRTVMCVGNDVHVLPVAGYVKQAWLYTCKSRDNYRFSGPQIGSKMILIIIQTLKP